MRQTDGRHLEMRESDLARYLIDGGEARLLQRFQEASDEGSAFRPRDMM
jgi:hypothetical protein